MRSKVKKKSNKPTRNTKRNLKKTTFIKVETAQKQELNVWRSKIQYKPKMNSSSNSREKTQNSKRNLNNKYPCKKQSEGTLTCLTKTYLNSTKISPN